MIASGKVTCSYDSSCPQRFSVSGCLLRSYKAIHTDGKGSIGCRCDGASDKSVSFYRWWNRCRCSAVLQSHLRAAKFSVRLLEFSSHHVGEHLRALNIKTSLNNAKASREKLVSNFWSGACRWWFDVSTNSSILTIWVPQLGLFSKPPMDDCRIG